MIAPIVKSFAVGYVLGLVLLAALVMALDYFFAFRISQSVSIVPFVVGVQFAAQKFATREGVRPSGGLAWRAALAMTLAGLVISAIVSGVFMAISGSEAMFGRDVPASFFLYALVIIFVIYLLIARFLFTFMAKSALKAAARRE